MEQLLGFFRRKKDIPSESIIPESPRNETSTELKREELMKLASSLEDEGYNLDLLTRELNKQTVGTTNEHVSRFLQLHSELMSNIPVANVNIDESFSERATVESILEQVAGDLVPVSVSPYTDLDERIKKPYMFAISVAEGLQPNSQIDRFADMFRFLNSAGKCKAVVYYKESKDVPKEIMRNMGYVARTNIKD